MAGCLQQLPWHEWKGMDGAAHQSCSVNSATRINEESIVGVFSSRAAGLGIPLRVSLCVGGPQPIRKTRCSHLPHTQRARGMGDTSS